MHTIGGQPIGADGCIRNAMGRSSLKESAAKSHVVGAGACSLRTGRACMRRAVQAGCKYYARRWWVRACIPAGRRIARPGGRAPNQTTNGGAEPDKISASISPESVPELFLFRESGAQFGFFLSGLVFDFFPWPFSISSSYSCMLVRSGGRTADKVGNMEFQLGQGGLPSISAEF